MASQRPDVPQAALVDIAIGGRIRELRRHRGISLDALGSKTGLSIGFLSQVERGLSSPSIRVLATVADVLGVALADLFDPNGAPQDHDDVVVRRDRRSQLQLWRSGITKQLLTPAGDDSGLSLFLVQLDPGASTGDETYTHAGEEAGLILSGRLMLTVDGRSWELAEGDSFRFPSRKPHRFGNPDAARPGKVVWINVVPK